MISLDQFKAGYLTECDELLADMEARLMELSPETADAAMLNAIFRCAHSIKGGAGAFGLDYITHFTHALEALLDSMREGTVPPTRTVVDTLLKAVDVVAHMVQCAKTNSLPEDGFGADVLGMLEELGALPPSVVVAPETPLPASENQQQWLIEFAPHESLFTSGNDPLLILRELEKLGTSSIHTHCQGVPPLDHLHPELCYLRWTITLTTGRNEASIREIFEFVEGQCDLSIQPLRPDPVSNSASATADVPHASADAGFSRRATDAPSNTTIRVDLDKVDRLVNMVGELVITEAMIKAQARDLSPEHYASLLRGVDELSHHTRELQEAVMSVRMQPVKSIFSRIPRVVRDLSAQLGKDIVLQMSGEHTEVDKTVIEQLGDPITHMIRNSADHGIEMPEARIAAGKPAQGTIILSAYHQGGRIIIEIRDDGAGINREKVLAKAKAKGLIAPDAVLSDEECDQLIFMPGFSTAEVVSNVSGRGVGMDVVRRNIENLQGTVRVRTEPGKGATFTVSLPLTLAILDGMIVRVGCENYIIPITNIIETMRPCAGEVRHVNGTNDVLNVRGIFVPILYLYEIFNIQGAQSDPSKALVVLVESGHDTLGLVVDELVGQQQVVIKSLEANTNPIAGISGATILGDGHVSLILEITQLKQLGLSNHHHSPLPAAA